MKIDNKELQTTASLFAAGLQKKRALMAKLDSHNKTHPNKPIKYDPESVIFIDEINGKVVFLERGHHDEEKELRNEPRAGAGYKHILRHAKEFKMHNIPIAKVPHALFATLHRNKVVGKQGKKDGRPIYEGHNGLFAITVGSNGYIVGANPTSKSALKK